MKIQILSFVAGLVLGFFLSCLLFHSKKQKEKPLLPLPSPKELQKDVAKVEDQYNKKYDSLKVQSIKLGAELKETKTALEKSKQKEYSLRVQVFDLLDKRYEKQILENNQNDSLGDSLSVVVPQLLSVSTKKDSLYEVALSNLDQQLQNKDSTIQVKEELYKGLKTTFEKSLFNQTVLEQQNKSLTKEAKRQKVKSKILSAALFLFSGAAANYLLHH